MKRTRFTIGPKQLSQFEKGRKAVFRVKDTEYEIVLADNIDITIVPSDQFDSIVAAKQAETNKSKMN